VIEAGRDGIPVTVAADGTSCRQYLHVDDAAQAVLQALAAAEPRQLTYNITGGTYVAEAKLAAMIRAFVPALIIESGPPAWNEGHLGPLLIDAARRDLGFLPQVELRDGLAALAAAIVAERP
jgi:nucleoside-diphosphate-sugar epimerase